MQKVTLVVAITLALTVAPAIAGKMFKWTDENGKTHYTDSKSKIPRKYRKSVGEMRSLGGSSTGGSVIQSISNEELQKGLDEGKKPEEMMPGPPKPSEECYAVRGLPKEERDTPTAKRCLRKLDAFEKYNQDFLNRWEKFQQWQLLKRMEKGKN